MGKKLDKSNFKVEGKQVIIESEDLVKEIVDSGLTIKPDGKIQPEGSNAIGDSTEISVGVGWKF